MSSSRDGGVLHCAELQACGSIQLLHPTCLVGRNSTARQVAACFAYSQGKQLK